MVCIVKLRLLYRNSTDISHHPKRPVSDCYKAVEPYICSTALYSLPDKEIPFKTFSYL